MVVQIRTVSGVSISSVLEIGSQTEIRYEVDRPNAEVCVSFGAMQDYVLIAGRDTAKRLVEALAQALGELDEGLGP
jgi:hypothetical protein